MRLASVRIENFRCLRDLTVAFDAVTVLVGANGSGKSSVLRALEWFFNGGSLAEDDVWRHENVTVTVTATFEDLTDADRAALGSYASGETLTLWRTWSAEEGEKLTGRGLAYRPFEEVRAHQGARELRAAYQELREAQPELGLEQARSADAAREAMAAWEADHPEQLEASTYSATHLFGAVGQPKLLGRFDYAFVSAVSEQSGLETLLARLLERLPTDQARLDERMEEVIRDATAQIEALLDEEQGGALRIAGERVTQALQQYVRNVEVSVAVEPPSVKIGRPRPDMRIADEGIDTDVGHQGHGLQRALLMAMLQGLARDDEVGDLPAVMLAIEEPELYQHPVQARHFSSVLASLARRGEGAFQVAYATHSAFFVDPRRYERLRRFSRRQDGQRLVSTATRERVAERLDGIVAPDRIDQHISLTLERTLAEAVFADAALLVEGRSDSGLLSGLAERDDSLARLGVAVVNTNGKATLPLAWAVLAELAVPTYVVFDGDRDLAERMQQAGASEEKAAAAEAGAAQWNRKLTHLLAGAEAEWPETTVAESYAVFETDIESAWPEAITAAAELANAAGDWRSKPEEWYREAAGNPAIAAPESLVQIIARVRGLL